MLRCAVGILYNSSGQILISKRQPHKIGGDRYEFPGGKIEANETAEEALVRELQEELGVTPLVFEEFLKVDFDYLTHAVRLETFLVSKFSGEPQGLEGQAIAWANIEELSEYPFLSANAEIIRKLERNR